MAAEEAQLEKVVGEKIESDEYVIMKGGKFVWLDNDDD